MSRIILDVSISLDGYAAGPDISDSEPMGVGGEALHSWLGSANAVDAQLMADLNAAVGATVVGRRTFDVGLQFWGGTPWPNSSAFVVTHQPRDGFATENGGRFAFTTLTDAAVRAKAAAGARDVTVLGPTISSQLMGLGLIDELWLHIVPIVLGGGTRLFPNEIIELAPLGPPTIGTVIHQRFRPTRPNA